GDARLAAELLDQLGRVEEVVDLGARGRGDAGDPGDSGEGGGERERRGAQARAGRPGGRGSESHGRSPPAEGGGATPSPAGHAPVVVRGTSRSRWVNSRAPPGASAGSGARARRRG